MKGINKAKYLRSKSKASINISNLTNGGICGSKIEMGKRMLLDGKHEVVVEEQRLLNNYTIVRMGSVSFEVITSRLENIPNSDK